MVPVPVTPTIRHLANVLARWFTHSSGEAEPAASEGADACPAGFLRLPGTVLLS